MDRVALAVVLDLERVLALVVLGRVGLVPRRVVLRRRVKRHVRSGLRVRRVVVGVNSIPRPRKAR